MQNSATILQRKIISKQILEWKEHGIRLRVIDLPTTMMELPEGQEWVFEMVNNILIEVLGTIAEQERETIHRRQADGIAAAKAKGKHLGRPKAEIPETFEDCYQRWKNGEVTASWAIKEMNISRGVFYRIVKQYKAGGQ